MAVKSQATTTATATTKTTATTTTKATTTCPLYMHLRLHSSNSSQKQHEMTDDVQHELQQSSPPPHTPNLPILPPPHATTPSSCCLTPTDSLARQALAAADADVAAAAFAAAAEVVAESDPLLIISHGSCASQPQGAQPGVERGVSGAERPLEDCELGWAALEGAPNSICSRGSSSAGGMFELWPR